MIPEKLKKVCMNISEINMDYKHGSKEQSKGQEEN